MKNNCQEIKKISKKIDLNKVTVQGNKCKYVWDKYYVAGGRDCLHDCYGGSSPYYSDKY